MLKACQRFTVNRLNPCDPMRRLPIKLVEEIFRLAIDRDEFAITRNDYATGMWHCYPGLALYASVLSHVCHQWRQIILSISRLWTRIHVNRINSETFSTWVARSKTFPLYISVESDHPRKVSWLLPNAHRIHALHIRIDKHWDVKTSSHVVPKLCLPSLEVCELVCNSYKNSFLWPNILQHSPRLKLLSLVRVSSLPLLQCPLLTHLMLRDCDVKFSAVFYLLARSPLLQEVVLEFGDPFLAFEQPLSSLPHITLNRLTHLFIGLFLPNALTAFFSKVTFNPMAILNISAHYTKDVWAEEKPPAILSRTNAMRSATRLYITMGQGGFGTRIIAVAGESLPIIRFQMCNSDRVLLGALDLFSLSNITEVWIGPSPWISTRRHSMSADTMLEVLRRLPALQKLVIHADYAKTFSSVLKTETSYWSKWTLCPKLEIIRFGHHEEMKIHMTREDVLKFVKRFSKIRPSVQFFFGKTCIDSHSCQSRLYDGRVPKSSLPEIPNSLFPFSWGDWSTCFDYWYFIE